MQQIMASRINYS